MPKAPLALWIRSYSISIWLTEELDLRIIYILQAPPQRGEIKVYWNRSTVTPERITGHEIYTQDKAKRNVIKMKRMRCKLYKRVTPAVEIP